MITLQQPAQAEIRYSPSYEEIASPDTYNQYQNIKRDLFESREGSDFVRRTISYAALSRQLAKLARLSRGWDTYKAEAPSSISIIAASRIGKKFIQLGLVPDVVVPSSEGGVALCFLRNPKYADVECFNTGEVLAVRYSANQDPVAWSITLDDATIDATAAAFSEFFSL